MTILKNNRHKQPPILISQGFKMGSTSSTGAYSIYHQKKGLTFLKSARDPNQDMLARPQKNPTKPLSQSAGTVRYRRQG